MPQNNEIIARLEDDSVIEATLYPSQGIQAQIDKVYLYNPDVGVNVLHDETLKGVGTSGNPLGLSDEILARIDRNSKTFVFDFDASSTVWVIHHNLEKRPSVVVIDSANSIVEATVEYLSDNAIQLIFNHPFKGQAYLN